MQFSYIMYVIKIYSIKVFLAMRLLFSEVDIFIFKKKTTVNGQRTTEEAKPDNGQRTTEEAKPDNGQQTTDNGQ